MATSFNPTTGAALLGAVVIAAGLGWWSRGLRDAPQPRQATERSETQPDAPPGRSDAPPPAPEEPELLAPGRPGSSERAAARAEPPNDADEAPLFSAALMEHARKVLIAGWAQERRDRPTEDEVAEGLDTFQARTLALPQAIGIELAERRSDLELAEEDARTGGVLTTLQRLEAGGPGPLFPLVSDRATFDRFFVAESSGAALDGPSSVDVRSLSTRKPVPDGTTLSFPAGVHRLPDFGSYWREHFPRDLTLRGAGMNATLLVLSSDLSAYDTVRNLTIEHVTIHTGDNYLFDVREPAMSVTVRNARFTGWDMGAGSSCLFGTEGLALRATDCEFLGGYGRSPSSGQLFDVRHNGLLARFERCLVARTEAFRYFGEGATVVFSACRLEDLLDRGAEPPANVRLDASSLTRWSQETSGPLARDLNDLFPGWKDALDR